MRQTATALLVTLALSWMSSVSAQAALVVTENDQEVYAKLYKEKLALVRRTPSSVDNFTLAGEMIRQARAIPDSATLQSLIYTDAIALAAEGGDLRLMQQAAELLNQIWPEHPAATPLALVELASHAYRDSPSDRRADVADIYLDLLQVVAEDAEKQDNLDQAMTYCKQAYLIARAVDSPKRDRVEQTMSRLSQASDRADRVRMLTISVRKNPSNRAAAKELVQLLFVEQDNAEAAAEFAELIGDEDFTEIVLIASKGIDQAGAPQALRVGDWYFGRAEELEDDKAVAMLERACRWYGRFASTYPRQDTLMKRVKLMDSVARGRLERAGHSLDPELASGWIDLIVDRFDPEKDTVSSADGRLSVRDGAISTNHTDFYLHSTQIGSYELRTRLTITEVDEGKAAVIIYLPVGSAGATFQFTHIGQRVCWIDGLPGAMIDGQSTSRIGKEIDLMFEVSVGENDQLGIKVFNAEKLVLTWQGPANELTPSESYSPAQDKGNILRFSCPSRITFHEIKMREK